ncbi:hypothetical protein K239x_14460 [Planctomycetes bacterium K23_9]|uniref:Cytochrome c domain-containing protein n=2 Tax=Stieleria marina TaxID=1930275 RepID=A0A517NQV4_9BACT|nr:hypothetical protein K239x_14460 [Planctomycetes bacterium K23_9]
MFRMIVAAALMMASQIAVAQLSFDLPPIEYSTTAPTDPVAKLNAKVASGDLVLQRDAKFGYLPALLEVLQIPLSSQTLVFSKTSMQRHLISPANPRAIYFNDQTYVGWVPHGEVIEISSTDPMLGTTFYTIEQYSPRRQMRISRRTERCLFCHASSDTGRVPGLLMQSTYTDLDGHRVMPVDSIWPKSSGPLQTRWGGWFATGTHGQQSHLGNLMIDSGDIVTDDIELNNGNVSELSKWFDVTTYPSPHSDLVALMVLEHQVTMHNRLTDTNHRVRHLIRSAEITNQEQGRVKSFLTAEEIIMIDQLAEDLVDTLLMVGALKFSEPVLGSSQFGKEFSAIGPVSAKGKSLRTLDLQRRLFRYPCSYLIYSDSFAALPEQVKTQSIKRLAAVLNGVDVREKYSHLSSEDRVAIREILRSTKPEFAL